MTIETFHIALYQFTEYKNFTFSDVSVSAQVFQGYGISNTKFIGLIPWDSSVHSSVFTNLQVLLSVQSDVSCTNHFNSFQQTLQLHHLGVYNSSEVQS